MIRKIYKCRHCKPQDDDCQWCGKQGYIASCDNRTCLEYGHGDSGCTMWVSDDEVKEQEQVKL